MIVNGIDTKDISVVVQGAVDKINTPKCLESIRKFLPCAEIVLSTWEGTDVTGLDADIVVKSKDPLVPNYNFLVGRTIPVNINRQLISVQEGLKKCTKTYTLKLRTDFFLKNADFINFYDSYEKRGECFKFFKHRVIINSIFSRRFSDENGFPTPYHPSDFFLFGLTDDLRDYFLGTENDEDDDSYHYKFPDRKCYFNMTGRYSPEQYYCVEWIKRHGVTMDFEDFTCWTLEKLKHSDAILFNNFIFLDPNQAGIWSDKHDYGLRNFAHNYGSINNALFNSEYKKRYDAGFVNNYTTVRGGGNLPTSPKNLPDKQESTRKERYRVLKFILRPVRPLVRIFLKRPLRLLRRFWDWCG